MSIQASTTVRSLENTHVSVTRGDVTVEKNVDTSHDDFLAVEITIRSSSTRALEVGIYEEIPSPIDRDDIGFHPGFDPENWTNNGRYLRYRAQLDPDETRKSVYAVRETDLRGLRALLAPPVVRISSP